MKRIAVLCRGTAQGLDQASKSVLKMARELGEEHRIELFLFGPVPRSLPPGVEGVVHFPSSEKGEGLPGPDTQAHWLVQAVRQRRPEILLAPADLWGRALMPVAAALLGAGLTADCTQLWLDGEERLHQVRPAFGGKLLAEILSREGAPVMATVRWSGETPEEVELPVGQVWEMAVETPFQGVKYFPGDPLSFGEGARLEDSRVVVAGGAGLGSRENFQVISRLARLLHASPAASRAAVNAGYAPYSWQVGQSGHTVSPEVYLALGISGAVQHLSGIQGAKTIVAVNRDPKAPIFAYADIGIVGDWKIFAHTLIQHFKEAEHDEAGQRSEI